MEVGGEGDYIPIASVITRMTSSLRWAVMRAFLMFRNCEGQNHKTVSTDHNYLFFTVTGPLYLPTCLPTHLIQPRVSWQRQVGTQ